MQAIDRIALLIAPDQVIPFWYQISKRATLVAEGNSAIHTASSLPLERYKFLLFVDLTPIADTNIDRATFWQLTIVLKKTFGISH
jgi:hypothetical protein